jgi:error-prone DNA polymerase
VEAHLAGIEHGVQVIHGAEITVAPSEQPHATRDAASVVLLAADHSGYTHLCQLISRGRLRNPKGFSTVTWEEVCNFSPGLIALLVDNGRRLPTDAPLPRLAAAFPGRLYLGLSRHYLHREVPREEELRRLAEMHNIPLVAAPEVLYHDTRRKPLQDVLTCIRHHTTLDEAGTLLKANDRFVLPSSAELQRRYLEGDGTAAPALLDRTREIARRCRFSLSEIEYRYPSESLPEGYTTSAWLRSLAWNGARRRYEGRVPQEVARQLEKELDIIDELDYSGYFLTMWEIVEYCRREGILCQGRGSAANSSVCYCLGITAVDPVRMDLLFERFLSRERAEPPDIDLDIEHNRREEVIQHMYEKYGRSHAAMVANIIRYRRKSALREVGKVLGFPETSLDRCARLSSRNSASVAEIVTEAGLDTGSPRVGMLVDLVEEILEFPRHLSIHPGGFLLGSEPVSHLVPVENATMPDRTVIQWDKYDVEHMNLFKVDLLGLGALTHLDLAFRLLRRHYGERIGMAGIPAHDPAVFRMISKADTVGVFQIESRAQMSMLPRLQPRRFYDLVIEVSIVRPGPITGGMVHPYLARRAGEEPVIYPHESIRPVLEKTLGVPLFQEQVMKLAVVAADYSPGEADQLRRDMAAWRKSGRIEKHRERLISRMTAKGIAAEFAERVFEQIRGFGEYGFPESHAASFALIAWSTAWVKHHYPDVFACALLNAWPMGFYAPSTIVEDAKRHGVEVRPVDLRFSEWECTLEPREQSGFAVRMGLRYVKGLSRRDAERIDEARPAVLQMDHPPSRDGQTTATVSSRGSQSLKAGPAALRKFLRSARLDADVLETLAQAGALRGFGIERREALWRVLGRRPASRTASWASTSSTSTSSAPTLMEDPDTFNDAQGVPSFPDLDEFESIHWDYSTSRHSTAGHPIEAYREQLRARGLPDARRLAETANGGRVSYAGVVICRQRPSTASGTVFITMEDETGFVNTIVWKSVFEAHHSLIITSSFLGVSGRFQNEDGVAHIIVDAVWKPEVDAPTAVPEARDFH